MSLYDGLPLQYVILKNPGEQLKVFFHSIQPELVDLPSKSKPGTTNPYALFKVQLAHDGSMKYLALHQQYDENFIQQVQQFNPGPSDPITFFADYAVAKDGSPVFSKKDGSRVVRTSLELPQRFQRDMFPSEKAATTKPPVNNFVPATNEDEHYIENVTASWALKTLMQSTEIQKHLATGDREYIIARAHALIAVQKQLVTELVEKSHASFLQPEEVAPAPTAAPAQTEFDVANIPF